MKVRRFRQDYRETASSLHKHIGEVLRNSPLFCHHKIYQEYPVDMIDPKVSGRYKFDWVVLDLMLVIEVHGEQHYQPVDFGGQGADVAEASYQEIKYRDRIKKGVALDAGFSYIEVPYHEIDQVDDEYLWKKYQANPPIFLPSPDPPEITTKKLEILDRMKQYRREQYKKSKDFKKG